MIWCSVDPNLVTSPTFVLVMGTIACIFGMLDIMTEIWLLCERLYG